MVSSRLSGQGFRVSPKVREMIVSDWPSRLGAASERVRPPWSGKKPASRQMAALSRSRPEKSAKAVSSAAAGQAITEKARRPAQIGILFFLNMVYSWKSRKYSRKPFVA